MLRPRRDNPMKCKYCGTPTTTDDQLCDGCWEMHSRMERYPKRAIQMMRDLGILRKPTEVLNQLEICCNHIDTIFTTDNTCAADFSVLATLIEETFAL